MATKTVTINEALIWQKTLVLRHQELMQLRNENARRTRSYLGAHADREVITEPLYDVKALDKLVGRLAREMRLLEQAIKSTNAVTTVVGYQMDEDVLGEVS